MNEYSKVNPRVFLYYLYFTNTCNVRECLKSDSIKLRLKYLRQISISERAIYLLSPKGAGIREL